MKLLIAFLSVLTFVVSEYECIPSVPTNFEECSAKLKYCANNGQAMKFTMPFKCLPNGKTPKGKAVNRQDVFYRQDSGCQCKNYCGYKCQKTCNLNRPLCTWKKGACYYKSSGVKGFPMNNCGNNSPTKSRDIDIPSASPSNSPTSKSPTSVGPTSKSPTSVSPTSKSPTSVSPTSKSPTSVSPTSKSPTSVSPTSKSPTSVSPTSKSPTSKSPTSKSPTKSPIKCKKKNKKDEEDEEDEDEEDEEDEDEESCESESESESESDDDD